MTVKFKILGNVNAQTHGHCPRVGKASKTYNSWGAMRSRCLNPNVSEFKYYGGRGITICDKWQTFAGFLEDMGVRPEGKTLDRKDSNGNYNKDNCKWSTPKEQQSNRSFCVYLEHGGQTKTVSDWAEDLSMSPQALFQRLKANWSVEKALTTPRRGT